VTGRPPLVDVIVPAYNAARFLRAAIDSALAQDGPPLRVIVVNDGSTDDTEAIARAYGDPVVVVSQANRGLPGARNRGIAESTAPYLALLDADDVWKPGKIARQVAVLDAHPEVGFVFTDMTIFQGDMEVVEDGYLDHEPGYRSLARVALGDGAALLPAGVADRLMRENFVSPSTVMLRGEAIRRIGGFDEAFRVCEDIECWLRLLRDWRAAAIEERLVLSRRGVGNLTAQHERMLRGRLMLVAKALAQPELYPPGAPEHFRRERPVRLYRLGRLKWKEGDVRAAREHLRASLRERPRPVTALALATTFLGPRARGALLRCKRALGYTIRTPVD